MCHGTVSVASATILHSITYLNDKKVGSNVSYQGLSVSWDSHTDPCSIQPCTSKLTSSILSLFSLGSVPTKEFIKAIKTTTNLLKKTNSSSKAPV